MRYQTEKGISKLELVLDRVEENQAILIGERNEELTLDKKFLPKEAIEGEALILTIATDTAETKRREATAKDILNEILRLG